MTTTTTLHVEDVILVPAVLADPAALATAPDANRHPEHAHDIPVGYVVRRTRKDGETIPVLVNGRVGTDGPIFIGAGAFEDAAAYADLIAGTPGSDATFDHVWDCGCRS